jgi:hypothetical protein
VTWGVARLDKQDAESKHASIAILACLKYTFSTDGVLAAVSLSVEEIPICPISQ